MNKEIEMLYKTLEAKDKIINEQILEIARLEKAKEILLKDRKKATDLFVEYKQRIDKAIEYTKQFINGETSRIDEWKNVELVLETIVEILGEKENE